MASPALNSVAASSPVATTSKGAVKARPLANLPSWCSTLEARQLLKIIATERPERTKVLTEQGGGFPADFGYRGKAAAQLRAIWTATLWDMMQACPQPGPRDARGMRADEAYVEARDGLIRFEREHGCEAVIARLLGDAS